MENTFHQKPPIDLFFVLCEQLTRKR